MGRYGLATVCIAYALLVASVAGALVGFTPGVAAPNHGGSNDAVGQGGQGVAAIHPLRDGSLDGPESYDDRDFGAHGTMGIQRTWECQLYACSGSDGTSRAILHVRTGDGGAPVSNEPEPEFAVTSVTANRSTVVAGAFVTVTATVENRGDVTGSEQVGPTLERRPIELREVTLEPGESRNLTFVVTLEEPGEQTIGVGERETTVTVRTVEPSTALTSLRLVGRTIEVGETAIVVATVTNTGGTTGEQTLSLEVFDEVVDRKTVTVPPGETRTVRFTQQFAGAGDYTLIVGDRSTTVQVRGEQEQHSETFDASDTGGPTPGLGLVVGGGLTMVLATLVVSSQL